MPLNQYVADARLRIFEDLQKVLPPREGEYSEQTLRDGQAKGKPQMGSTRFEPDAIVVEFIYPEARSASTVLTVRLPSPERIVFLPVPAWVVESIWQGEISGSHHFESDAMRLVEDFRRELDPETNPKHFGPQAPTRRV